MVLICSSLMISDVEHLFMYLQAISISPLKKCSDPLPVELFGFSVVELNEFYIYFGY